VAYPYSSDTLYQPHPSQAGTAAKFRAVLDAHGLTHGLLVGAGPYPYRDVDPFIAAAIEAFTSVSIKSAQDAR
jgi:hypothetical protein